MVQQGHALYDAPMTSNLLRAATLILLTAASSIPAHADGRADWKDYAWQQIKLSQCSDAGNTITCPLYHQKWDWKRNQWVDITITLDRANGELHLTQRLTDNDKADDDDVCVTALAVDAAGKTLLAHHQNWRMRHGEVTEKSFTYRSPALDQIAAFAIGSKQCRQGAHQDDAVYARVLAGIQ